MRSQGVLNVSCEFLSLEVVATIAFQHSWGGRRSYIYPELNIAIHHFLPRPDVHVTTSEQNHSPHKIEPGRPWSEWRCWPGNTMFFFHGLDMVTIEPWQVWGEPLKASFQKVWDIGHMSQKDERFQGWKDCVHGQRKVFHFLSKMEVGCSLLPHQMKHGFLQTIAADKAPWSIVGMFSSKVGCSLSCPTFMCVFVWLVLGCNLKQSQGYVGWFPAQSSTTLERREVEWSRVPNAISWVWYGKFM